MDVTLNEEESAVLQQALQTYLSELRSEISDRYVCSARCRTADSSSFRVTSTNPSDRLPANLESEPRRTC